MDERYLNQRRQETNRELLELLQSQIEKFPSERFSQILANGGFVQQAEVSEQVVWKDEFNLEPWQLLERVQEVSERLSRG